MNAPISRRPMLCPPAILDEEEHSGRQRLIGLGLNSGVCIRILHRTSALTSKADFQLASNWTPTDQATGILTLTLTNLSGRPLENFRLASLRTAGLSLAVGLKAPR